MTYPLFNREDSPFRLATYAVTALLLTAINYPLARFPSQDLLWNDLALLGRLSWASAALIHNPFASVDFLQGLGSNVISDVKLVTHVLDPGVLFAVVAGPVRAMVLRSIFLIIYCMWSVETLWAQETKRVARDLGYPLALFYAASPSLLFEVSHHFSAVFYTVPGLIVAFRYFVACPKWNSGLFLVAASTLYTATSDLHIVFFVPIIGVFLLVFDRSLLAVNFRTLFAAFGCIVGVIVASFAGVLLTMALQNDVAMSRGAYPVAPYVQHFLVPAVRGLWIPEFAYPISTYVAPYVPIVILLLFRSKSDRSIVHRIVLLLAVIFALFFFGYLCHRVEWIRTRLPSAMRYHLLLIPVLTSLWLILHGTEIVAAFSRLHAQHLHRLLFIVLVLCGFLLLSASCYRPEQEAFLSFERFELHLSRAVWLFVGLFALTLYPASLSCLMVFAGTLSSSSLKRSLVWMGASAFVILTYYTARSFGLPATNFLLVDRRLSELYFVNLPSKIDTLIRNSGYANRSRSVMPLAFSPVIPDRGWNDKLLPLIEYPEMIGARAFFQWRYSYSSHISALYQKVTRQGPGTMFPPVPQYQQDAVDFAIETGSSFIVSADAHLDDSRLDLLGKFPVEDVSTTRDLELYNSTLFGTIYIYAVRIPEDQRDARIDFSRISAVIHRTSTTGNPPFRIPFTYFRDLRAYGPDGELIPLTRGADGFAYLETSADHVTLGSFSFFSLLALLSPFVGSIPLFFAACPIRR